MNAISGDILLWLGLFLVWALVFPVGLVAIRRLRQPRLRTWATATMVVAVGLAVGLGMPRSWLWPWSILTAGFLLHFGKPERHVVLVWWKHRMRGRGTPIAGFWDEVNDEYVWDEAPEDPDSDDASTELEAADAPVGRGTEPEAAAAPAGRGSELEPARCDTADAETDGVRAPEAMREGPAAAGGGRSGPRYHG